MHFINQVWFYTKSADWQDERRGRVSRKDAKGLSAAICIQPRYASDEEWEANAKLISRAPRMLRVLKHLVDKSYEDVITPEDRAMAEDILDEFGFTPEPEENSE